MKADYKYIIKPLLEHMGESGDLIYINDNSNIISFSVIDGLGHGKNAHTAAQKALDYLEQNCVTNIIDTISNIHNLLKSTRGAVIGLCVIDKSSGNLTTCGIGNITTRLIGNESQKIFYQDGIAGLIKPRLKSQEFKVHPGDIIIMYSDGVKENFDLLEVPNIRSMSAWEITNDLFKRYSKESDDASILTVKLCYD